MHALRKNCNIIVQLLLDRGAALHFPEDPYARTPLIVACGYCRESTVLLLLERGARLDPVDCSGRSAMTYASDRPEIARLLSDRSPVQPRIENVSAAAAGSTLPPLEERRYVILQLASRRDSWKANNGHYCSYNPEQKPRWHDSERSETLLWSWAKVVVTLVVARSYNTRPCCADVNT